MGKKKLILLLILLISINSYAVLLGECHIVSGCGFGFHDDPSFDLNWWSWGDYIGDLKKMELFGPVYSSDIGKTTIISSTTPAFESFVSILTNGILDSILHGGTLNGAKALTGKNEDLWFVKFVESYGVDFQGYNISEISQSINDFSASYTGSRVDYSFDVTYRLYGELIPEPATLLLFGLGTLALRRRK